MSRIFLSHSSKNNAEARALADWLAAQGFDDLFLDLDPQRGIVAGERWERALHQAAQRCEAVLFLVSKPWLESDWCLKEFNLAHRLNKRLFGILIEDIPFASLPATLTGTWQLVPLVSGRDHIMLRAVLPTTHEEVHVTFSQEGLTRLKIGLERAGLGPKFFAWPPKSDPGRAPYRGLRALEAEDAGIFFGREAATIGTVDRLRGLSDAAPPRFLVILGASGAGKSSYLRAGLLPKLARDDRHFLAIPVVRPERAAINGESGLLRALEKAFADDGVTAARADIRAAIAGGVATLRPLLAQLVDKALSPLLVDDPQAKPPVLVLPIDQGEELFHSEGAQEGQALLTLLAELLAEDSPAMIVIVAIRSDSYERLQTAKPLESIEQRTISLPPMPRTSYQAVIEGPAARLKQTNRPLAIDPALTQALLADIESGGGRDALPLLAFTLERLYLEFGARGRLTLADYEQLGGVKGSIEAAVERALKAADGDARIPTGPARLTLLRRGLVPWLAGIDPETGSPRRRVARKSEIPEEARPLVDLLVEQRLLSTDVAQDTREVTIEPAHEALLRQWGLLQGWLEEDFTALSTLESVKRAARDWDANAKTQAWLAHHGERLREAQGLDAKPDIAARLDATDRAYMAACLALEQAARAEAEQRRKEREEEQARRLADARKLARRTTAGLVVAVALALLAAGFGFFAQSQKLLAEQKGLIAEQKTEEALTQRVAALGNQSKALAALSTAALSTNPTRALKLALAAWPRRSGDRTPKVDVDLEALSAGVVQLRERKILRGHDDAVSSAAFSPDGARVVTASHDSTARLWDAASGTQLAELRGHHSWVSSAAFSPDGARVVTASMDNTVRLWDAATGKQLAVLRGHDNSVFSAAFSPDGARVVTASYDNTARLWDAATGKQLAVLSGHDNAVSSAAFSPDGARVVTASRDRTARLWDAASGTQLAVLSGHNDVVFSAAFSPDGARVVTASDDNTARLWDAASGTQLAELRGHDDRVWTAAFSPDGARVVTASNDNTARLWDAASGKQLAVLRGHNDMVFSAAFSPDGARVVTASNDNTARLWDAASGKQLAVLRGHDFWVFSAAFSPDGARVVTASHDNTARLWDAASGTQLALLHGHGSLVNSAAFSPDGTRVVTASMDNTVRLWDAASGKQLAVLRGHDELAVLRGHDGIVYSAAFSPDGARVVTASADTTARLWDAASGKQLAVLRGHDGTVNSAAFSPDGARVVTASADTTARLWDAASGKQLAVLSGHDLAVRSAAFSPDGARVVTASHDNTARLWDAASGTQLTVLRGHEFWVFSAAFSPDGARVVTASADTTARLWDAASGKQLAVLRGHNDMVFSAAFSPDGARVVTASHDNTARLWDAATGKQLAVLRGHGGTVNSAAFSPDGARVVTASADTTARLWDIGLIPKGNLFQVACAWLPDHDLTDIARDYGLTNLEPISETDPPLPDALPR